MLAAAPNTADWITAFGSAFAAIGTVGAVIVALWQTKRRERFSLHVTCKPGVTGDAQIGDIVTLTATNTGERLVKLEMAYLLSDDHRTIVAKFFTIMPGTSLIQSIEQSGLPVSLVAGEPVSVRWQLSTLEGLKQKEGFDHYHCAYFTDPLGNMYEAAYPGMKGKRKGWPWRRKTEYIQSDG